MASSPVRRPLQSVIQKVADVLERVMDHKEELGGLFIVATQGGMDTLLGVLLRSEASNFRGGRSEMKGLVAMRDYDDWQSLVQEGHQVDPLVARKGEKTKQILVACLRSKLQVSVTTSGCSAAG